LHRKIWIEEQSMTEAKRKQDRTAFSADRLLRTAALCALIGLLWSAPAMARGGGHGMAPAYVLITVSAVSDADAFKKAIQDMTTAVAPFTGRLAVDAEKPPSWEGAAAEHVVMIQFADPEQAQAWKDSEAFKSFDTDLNKSSSSTMQFVQALPVPEGHGGRGRFEAKAFEPNVRDFDRLLNQRLKTICRGC
jgi:uncharacterized protein (DUF1330 family)